MTVQGIEQYSGVTAAGRSANDLHSLNAGPGLNCLTNAVSLEAANNDVVKTISTAGASNGHEICHQHCVNLQGQVVLEHLSNDSWHIAPCQIH